MGAHVIDQAVQLFGMPEALFADIATLRTGGKVDDYFIIHLLRPAKSPDVKVTLKASYLMCGNEPRFVLHGTEGSFVKYGLDPQEAALNQGALPTTPHWGKKTRRSGECCIRRRTAKRCANPIPPFRKLCRFL